MYISVKFTCCSEQRGLLFDDPSVPNGKSKKTPTGYYDTFNVSLDENEISYFVTLGSLHSTSSFGSAQYFSL